MKYQVFHVSLLMLLVVIILGFASPGCLAVSTYTYSLSNNFTNGINVPEFESTIEKGLVNVTLIDVTVTGDVVDINFQDPISVGHQFVLGIYVTEHSVTSLLDRSCATLPDADDTITSAMIRLGLLVTSATSARTYTLMTATEMVDAGVSTGKFFLKNTGSASVTLGLGTGGTTTDDMVVVSGVPAQFICIVTNDITGSHAYVVLRVG